MPTALGFIILAGLAGLLGGAVGAIFARPRLRFILISVAQAGIFAWLAVESHREAGKCEAIVNARHDYLVLNTPEGDHTIRIDELPGVRGLHLELCYPQGSSPPTRDTMKPCEWRVNGKAVETDVLLTEFESDEWGRGDFKRLDITYRVTEKSKPHLENLVLRATAPRMVFKGAYIFRDINRGLALILGIGTIVGIAGLASQLLRARRKRESPARP